MAVAVPAGDLSLLERVALTQSLEQREAIARLATVRDLEALGSWHGTRRPSQSAPVDPDWFVWMVLAGRGFGKTRTGSEETIDHVEGLHRELRQFIRWAVIAPTFGDGRDIDIEGEAGLEVCLQRRGIDYSYNRSNGELSTDRWLIQLYSAEKPDRVRGPGFHGAWLDEPGSYRFPKLLWDLLLPTLRLGRHPHVIVTGTPKIQWLVKHLHESARTDPSRYRLTRGTTWRNSANLPALLIEVLEKNYRGTRLGRQELEGLLLEEAEGALWSLALLDDNRLNVRPGDYSIDAEAERLNLRRIADDLNLHKRSVGIDPAGSTGTDSDETGIIGAGASTGRFPHAYVLADRSGRWAPEVWARKAIDLAIEIGATRIVAERNYGGNLVEANIKAALRPDDPFITIDTVHAKTGKVLRAGPVATLYDAKRVHHVGTFGDLEAQMCLWVPEEEVGADSPDRIDALVYTVMDLLGGPPVGGAVSQLPGQLNR
jgi:phage terminase large subunit-like protein